MEYVDLIVMLLNALIQAFPDTVVGWVQLFVTVVGAASTIFIALEKVADVTPTDKDNLYIGRIRRFLAKVLAILDRLALNPDARGARKAK